MYDANLTLSLTNSVQRISKEVYTAIPELSEKPFGQISTKDRNRYREALRSALENDGYPLDENFSTNATTRLKDLGVPPILWLSFLCSLR